MYKQAYLQRSNFAFKNLSDPRRHFLHEVLAV